MYLGKRKNVNCESCFEIIWLPHLNLVVLIVEYHKWLKYKKNETSVVIFDFCLEREGVASAFELLQSAHSTIWSQRTKPYLQRTPRKVIERLARYVCPLSFQLSRFFQTTNWFRTRFPLSSLRISLPLSHSLRIVVCKNSCKISPQPLLLIYIKK